MDELSDVMLEMDETEVVKNKKRFQIEIFFLKS